MAFETQTINIQTKKDLATNEFAVNTKIVVDADKPLKRVLSIKAIADEVSSEYVDIDYTALGRTQINVLYLTENNELENITGYAEWQSSLKVVGENLVAKIFVVESNVESFSATEISVNVLQNIIVSGTEKNSFLPFSVASDDYVADYVTKNLNQICGYSNGKFVVTENIDMPTAQKVLSIDGVAKIASVTSYLDKVVIDGAVDVKILYASADGIMSLNKLLDFHQEVVCTGALDNQNAVADVGINSINATLEVGEKTNLVIALGLNAVVETYENKEITAIGDIFSLSKNITTTMQCVDYDNFLAGKYLTDTIVCNMDLADNNIDEVISLINPVAKISQCLLKDNILTLEGVVDATLIYKNNEIEEIESKNILCPFVSNIDLELEGRCRNLNVQATLSSVKIRSGKEIEVVLDLVTTVNCQSDEYFEFVKSVEELEDKPCTDSAITIYVTKENETLFDVAKALNVMPDVITGQNEVADGKFASGQRIFVYSPLNVEF